MDSPGSRIYFDPPTTDGRTVAARKGDKSKEFLDKVARLVPIEIVAGYKAATLLVAGVQPPDLRIYIYWTLFVLGVIGTQWYFRWQMGNNVARLRHLLIYGGAFVVWAYAITGDKLLPPPYYQDALAGIVVIVASVIFGRVKLPKVEVRR